MLLVSGSSLYIRNKATSEWLKQINFNSLIVALYPVKDGTNNLSKILCITESSLELLALSENGENIEQYHSNDLPSKPIRTNFS